ncbi:hypothetical protein SAMN04487970_10444 [Paenibacillus tianmuensis]|uniref:Uncharacterized protein n=1 Tax=Paenibacillus tianmuensis TaxID=624147 RepID=A0A1G4T6R8_9BACL|nr:hypothetical protein SAMN04487970_10444 [Paenibacillus tianmuensis]
MDRTCTELGANFVATSGYWYLSRTMLMFGHGYKSLEEGLLIVEISSISKGKIINYQLHVLYEKESLPA